jgi:hypothetical protein
LALEDGQAGPDRLLGGAVERLVAVEQFGAGLAGLLNEVLVRQVKQF